jgi:GT2 family glycosyltransferase
MPMPRPESRISVVMLTHERRDEVLRALERMCALPACPPLYVVDNGSRDGTAQAVRARFPQVRLVRLARNLGAAGRNAGVQAARTPYVAFCDDDTWWAPGSLERAAAILDRHPRLAAVTARVLVGPAEAEDPASTRMASSPLRDDLGVPGTLVLGMMAGACMVRRVAFLAAGGYEPRFVIGGEEALLALDLAAAGWRMAYAPDAIVHHHPSRARNATQRRRLAHRNALWCAWMRRPLRAALSRTAALAWEARRDPMLVAGCVAALAGLPWALARRSPIPPEVEAALRRVETYYAAERVIGAAALAET